MSDRAQAEPSSIESAIAFYEGRPVALGWLAEHCRQSAAEAELSWAVDDEGARTEAEWAALDRWSDLLRCAELAESALERLAGVRSGAVEVQPRAASTEGGSRQP